MTMGEDRRRLVYEVVRRHRRGESQRRIAKVLGIARKTVRKMLADHEERRRRGDDALAREGPRPRAPRPSKLDRYADRIEELLKQFPKITAQRVFEIITEEGFEGRYTIVRQHMRKVHPKERKRAHDPVTTPPGKQGQFDWSPYTLPGCGIAVNSFSLVLHYSSYQYVAFTLDRTRPTLLRQFVAAFDDLGGVPEEIVFDSEKTVVDRWELGRPIVNLAFLDFAAYYGFSVHVAPRADGAYKGGVESGHWVLEQNFLNGRRFYDLDDARSRLAAWRDRFSATRVHRTKGRTRLEMYQQEKPELQRLPAAAYDTSQIVWRIVDGFHRVLFETNTYSVPRAYVGAPLCVRVTEDAVRIYDGAARLLATHDRVPRGAREDRVLAEHRRKRRIDIDKVVEHFQIWGDDAATFAVRLRQRRRFAGAELSAILALQARYRVEDILTSIKHALDYDACSAKALERILQVRATPLDLHDVVTDRIRAEIRRALHRAPVRQRELEAYQKLLAQREDDDHTEDTDEPEDPDTS